MHTLLLFPNMPPHWDDGAYQRVVALVGTEVEKGVIVEELDDDKYKVQWCSERPVSRPDWASALSSPVYCRV